jgi:hypothetical protein
MKITRQGRSAVIDFEGLTRLTLKPSELREKAQRMLALAETLESLPLITPQFDRVSCSQCGRSFGPANAGFSHCKDHRSISSID